MPLIPIELPAGMMRNGTPYAARGRWADGNLVRWHDGSLRPIGGWRERKDSSGADITISLGVAEVVRDIVSYRTNIGNSESMFFSNDSVYLMNSGGTITDITPAAYPAGASGPTLSTGYGTGGYGLGAYGVARSTASATLAPADRTSYALWGENVLYAMNNDGPIFEHVPGASPDAALANAPTDVADFIVTDQRIVMAIKNETELRQVVWSDREDNTDWTPTTTNYADVRTLQGTGRLLGIYQVMNQVLILSETDAHIGRFVGAPFVYGFEKIGSGCEPIWRTAVNVTDRFAVWWGNRGFWMYDGTLKQLPCEVMDYLASDINYDAVSKLFTMVVSEYSEVWWYYQSQSSTTGDVDSYVCFDYVENHWVTGKLDRSAGMDRSAYDTPVMLDRSGNVWDHEIEAILVDGTAWATTGPLELEGGNKNMAVRYIFPDTEAQNDVSLSFTSKQMPTAAPVSFGPYAYSNPISTTGLMGRELRMTVTGLTSDWEVGTMRFDVQAVGGGFR